MSHYFLMFVFFIFSLMWQVVDLAACENCIKKQTVTKLEQKIRVLEGSGAPDAVIEQIRKNLLETRKLVVKEKKSILGYDAVSREFFVFLDGSLKQASGPWLHPEEVLEMKTPFVNYSGPGIKVGNAQWGTWDSEGNWRWFYREIDQKDVLIPNILKQGELPPWFMEDLKRAKRSTSPTDARSMTPHRPASLPSPAVSSLQRRKNLQVESHNKEKTRSPGRIHSLDILREQLRKRDSRIASRQPQPHRRQSSDDGPQNAIEDSIKVNQQTRAVARAAINQGYILGETRGPLQMPKISRPRNPTPGSFADRFRDRMPDQLGNDLGKQTGELLDLDSLPQAPTVNQAPRPAVMRNPDPGEGFEFNEGGFITPDANFEPDPPGSKTEMAQTDQTANPHEMNSTKSNQIQGKYTDPELNQIYEDFQKLKNSPELNSPENTIAELNELRQPEMDWETDITIPGREEFPSSMNAPPKQSSLVEMAEDLLRDVDIKVDKEGFQNLSIPLKKVVKNDEYDLGSYQVKNQKEMHAEFNIDQQKGVSIGAGLKEKNTISEGRFELNHTMELAGSYKKGKGKLKLKNMAEGSFKISESETISIGVGLNLGDEQKIEFKAGGDGDGSTRVVLRIPKELKGMKGYLMDGYIKYESSP